MQKHIASNRGPDSSGARNITTAYWAAFLAEVVGNAETRSEFRKTEGRSFWNAESAADLVEVCNAARAAGAVIHGGKRSAPYPSVIWDNAQVSYRTLWLFERGFMFGAIPQPWLALRAELKRRKIPLKAHAMTSEVVSSVVRIDGKPSDHVAIKIVTHKFIEEQTEPLFAHVKSANSLQVQALLLALDIKIDEQGVPYTYDRRGARRKLSAKKLQELLERGSLARK